MHMCCGPCSVYPSSVLQDEGAEITGFFYNPNIHPREEFERRMENVRKLSELKKLPVVYSSDFYQERWENYGGDEESRCRMCYATRLEKAAAHAAANGFDAFTTSLLVSPYQKHDVIRQLGEKLGEKYGVPFYYRDFRPGFRQGQQQAREMGLYRQKFCGCIVSYRESPFHSDKNKER